MPWRRLTLSFASLHVLSIALWNINLSAAEATPQLRVDPALLAAPIPIDLEPTSLLPLTPSRPAADPPAGPVPAPGMSSGGWLDSVSLEVPPGPAGSEPHLALTTNHMVADGILGAGYQLDGLSSIVRRGASGGVPDRGGPDSYYLDGRRLVRISARVIWPTPNVVDAYQPEMFDGSQLEHDAGTNTWTMARDGWTFVFGSHDGTGSSATKLLKLDSSVEPAPARSLCLGNQLCNTAAWYLSRVEDPHHNVLTYNYRIPTLPPDIYPGYGRNDTAEHLLDSIRYNDGDAFVRFTYGPRPDPQISYASGDASFATERLVEITSYSRSNEEFSRYRIEYKDEGGADCDGTAVSGIDEVSRPLQSLVRRIIRVGTEGHADAGRERIIRCIQTHHEQVAWENARDVSLDIPEPIGSSVPFNMLVPVPLHLDGDGITDLILLAYSSGSGSARWEAHHQAFRATPRNAKAFEASGPEVDAWLDLLAEKLPGEHFQEHRGYAFTDINRDGWTDLVYETIPADGSKGDVAVARWIPSRSGFSFQTLDILACDLRYGQFVEINGDGFPDLVRLAHPEGREDDCIERTSEWLPNIGLVPWLSRGSGNAGWLSLSTPAAAIAAARDITPPDLDNDWDDEDYVEAQARVLDLNGDGLDDLAYALWERWDEVCDPGDAHDCWYEPDWTSHYSRIYWGDGGGGFQDSGLSAGGPVLTRRTGVSEQADSRILDATESAADFMRGGRAQLLTTYNTSTNGVFGAKWRGIRLGFGDDAVTGASPQPASSVSPDFNFQLPQQPGLGDECFNNSAWLTYGDFDGDGYTDLLSFNLSETVLPGCGSRYCAKLLTNARTISEGRITASDGAWGGRTALTWSSSADAFAGNLSLAFPGAVEVLREWNGQFGRIKLHYAYPTQTQGRFQGFGLVEQEGTRGGLERFAFGVSPAMAGKLLYAARLRSDNTLERVSVVAYQGDADPNCFPAGECVQMPLSGGEPSSYTLDVSPPFANLPVRQCDYEVERSGPGEGGAASIAGLINHCHQWSGRDAPSASQLLAAAGLYRYPGVGWPAYLLSRAVWQDDDRLGENLKQAIVLSDANEPDGDHGDMWNFSELSAWTTGWREIASRWPAPAGAPMPPPADLEKLAALDEAATGRGFSAYVVDREYDAAAHKAVAEDWHRDVLTTADDLHRVNSWAAPPRPDWASTAPPERRLASSVLQDGQGIVLWQITRDRFEPAHFDNPGRITICGVGGEDCRTDLYGYHSNGEVASHTRPDLAVESFEQSPFCGIETATDAAGRSDVRRYDERCRLVYRKFLGVAHTWEYDGQNRILRRSTTPNGGGPAVSIAVTQDDQFQRVQDISYQEPRLRERREQDGRQWLTYLDDFGRVTKRTVCAVDPRSPLPVCQAGTEQTLAHVLWGSDGLIYGSARPYIASGARAETPAFTVLTHDGAGRVILSREPAHVDLATEAADWTATRIWYAPGRLVTKDPLDRVGVRSRDTRSETLTVADETLMHSELDVLGRPTSHVGPDGVEIRYAYTPRGNLATESRATTPPSVREGTLQAVPWLVSTEYDVLDRPTRVTEPDGTAHEISWDPIGRPLQLTHQDRAGVATTLGALTYATGGDGVEQISIVDENGHATVQQFDGLGRALSEDDGLGTVTTWSYGVDGNVAQSVENSGDLTLTTRFGYDVAGRPAARTDPDGGTTRYVYNGADSIIETTGANGEQSTYSHFFSGLPFEARLLTEGGSWLLERMRYDAAGQPRVRIEGGVRRILEHDDLDRIVREVVGSGNDRVETLVDYDGTSERPRRHERLVVGAATGAVTRWRYDSWGRLESFENPDGDVSRFRYDVMDRLRFSIDPENFLIQTRYDDRGRIDLQTGRGRDVIRLAYAADTVFAYHDGSEARHQQQVTSTDAAGSRTDRWFDAAGRLIAEARAKGTRTEWRYAGDRLVDAFAVASDGAAVAQTRWAYLGSGVLDGRFGPAETRAFVGFDPDAFAGERVRFGIARGSRLEWLDAGGERTDFEYGIDGLLQTERFRGLTRTLERANPASSGAAYPRITGETLAPEAGGPVRSISYAFDAVGRLTERKAFDGQVVELATWDRFDQDGRARQERNVLDGVLQVEHLWDISPAGRPLSRRTTVAGAAPRTTQWSWRRNGARDRIIGPNGDGLAYDYGPDFDWEVDRVARLSGASLAQVQQRDPRGLPTRIQVGPAGRLVLDYDALGRLDHSRRTGSTGALELETRRTYDDLGRISREEFADADAAWVNAYTYSPAGRLLGETRERGGATENLAYELNAAGYRVSTRGTLHGVDQTMDAVYDPKFPVERLVAVDAKGKTTPIVYDAWDGVLTDQHGQQFTYAPSGELLTVQVEKSLHTYLRDADGVAWGELGPGGLRLTTWDLDPAGRPIQVEDPDAGVFGYAEADGLLVGRIDYAPASFASQSAGLTGSLLSEAGTSRTAGSAFGVGLPTPVGPGERMLYAGLEALPGSVGIHLARHRAYDAQTGRFLSPDPLGLDGGLHRSLYASGDPVNRFDPLGLSDCGSRGLPDLGSGSLGVRPPAYVEGIEGGPASPFGPGVAVSYVDQYAGDKTYTDRMNKWYSDFLIATSAGIFSFDWAEMFNDADDTDASGGSNSGGGLLGGLFSRGGASDVIVRFPTTQPEPETPEPETPEPLGGMPDPFSVLSEIIDQMQNLTEDLDLPGAVDTIKQTIEDTPGPLERTNVAAEAIGSHVAKRYGEARQTIDDVADCATDPQCRSGVVRGAGQAVRQELETFRQDPAGTAYNVGWDAASDFVGTVGGGVRGMFSAPLDAPGLLSGDPVKAQQAAEALEQDVVAQVETVLVVIPAAELSKAIRGAGRPFMRWITQNPRFKFPKPPKSLRKAAEKAELAVQRVKRRVRIDDTGKSEQLAENALEEIKRGGQVGEHAPLPGDTKTRDTNPFDQLESISRAKRMSDKLKLVDE